MRVFVTGATGFVGRALVRDLLDAGHEVLGLARSDTAAAALTSAGADVHRGDLEDLDALRAGAAAADGVVHTGFVHDFADFRASVRKDLRAVETLGHALAGSGRPFVSTSVTGLLAPSRPGTEEDRGVPGAPGSARLAAEEAALATAARGVRASVVRLPLVHGPGDHGFLTVLVGIARDKGVCGHAGDGANLWPAVHVTDAARLYRLALEQAPAGSVLHAVADEGVPMREIAAVVGRRLDLPVTGVAIEDVDAHFGWLGHFATMDNPVSSTRTRALLDWRPTRPGLLADFDQDHYFAVPTA
ncbi:SDR family oxidoreductase [Streptomyces mangrovisoli]|uniref:3-beta hydroxysteroid dehydrogenase n=1 Tax=Streptomyces mangrovisoli TaxID=1428628 RepID=A0A1J4P404_9ACTN|nr:SDR family oxidoreductase [Streptomyces mangrovisoli]OIJ68946.1 3-beta hydroxysteroid dehydrogenase [Streptomyces mangrovisoli]